MDLVAPLKDNIEIAACKLQVELERWRGAGRGCSDQLRSRVIGSVTRRCRLMFILNTHTTDNSSPARIFSFHVAPPTSSTRIPVTIEHLTLLNLKRLLMIPKYDVTKLESKQGSVQEMPVKDGGELKARRCLFSPGQARFSQVSNTFQIRSTFESYACSFIVR